MDKRDYVRKCDADFRERLYGVAHDIARTFEGEGRIKLVSLSGPTCSGKTTAAAMLAKYLAREGGCVHIISIDDFYYGREYLQSLSAEKGIDGIDYDSEHTIDLAALSEFIDEALTGEGAHCPVYDFKLGDRSGYRFVSPGENDVFIFEGIQAIYPNVVSLLEPHGFVSVYISPISPISHGSETFLPDDIRLMRRIVRDALHRSTSADFTLHLWDNVRLNEEKNIFPYADSCTYRIDSTHQYELGILKPYLDEMLADVPTKSDKLATAQSILARIKSIQPLSSSLIEEDSLYKEFI